MKQYSRNGMRKCQTIIEGINIILPIETVQVLPGKTRQDPVESQIQSSQMWMRLMILPSTLRILNDSPEHRCVFSGSPGNPEEVIDPSILT